MNKVVFWLAVVGAVAVPAFIAYKLNAPVLGVVAAGAAIPAAGLVVLGAYR